ncbi:unnamed protein product [Zymoseptoria tritici ST99CH_1A5]|uniref:NB-ARC domain-containing protein n=1 Tax=Zymoseptoria tritici ST99CH_1A5 TaxID=1276529 RepID=A0A1Y6LSI6_ZYMTR|nr:unnamed protein product [Zymoseptoria tritici ST99CH_1A5]
MEDLVAAIEEIGAVDLSILDTASTTICSSGTGALFNTGSGHMGVKQQNGDGNYQAETIYFQTPSAQDSCALNPTLKDPFYDPTLDRSRVDSALSVLRSTAVKSIEAKLTTRCKHGRLRHAVVVHGMGGTGKTQVVLQYVQRHRYEYDTLIWIDATSPETFVWSCARVSRRLKLPGLINYGEGEQALLPQRSTIVSDLTTWLEARPPSTSWLVVLDNLDDMTWGVKDVLPQGIAGTLIVTSRDLSTARLVGCGNITLDSMEIGEARSFLRAAAFPELEESSEELDALCNSVCDMLDCLPLAVHLAAATIETFVPLEVVELADACKVVTTYIDRFDANKDLLLMRDDHKFMQSPYPRTILTTFETTFRQLEGENRPKWEPSAMKLLRLLSWLSDVNVDELHDLFQQAYDGILHGCQSYAIQNLTTWISKVLSGESSVEYCDTRQNTSWDDNGYHATLGMLHRHGLIRPKSTGLPGMLPMHKIVRWRVQKESESHVRAYLSQYAVLLELALSSRSQDELGVVRLLNELADTYRNIGKLQYAESCARLHTERQCDMRGRHHAETVKSLERLIAILGQQGEESMMKYEMFVFLKDAADRAAVLAALPGHLLMLLNSAFRLEESHSWPPHLAVKESEHRHASRNYSARALTTTLNESGQRNDKPGSSYPNYPGKVPIDSLGAWAPQESLSQPASKDQRLQDEVLSQIMRRKAVLTEAASTKPDLVTLFEVFSMGSRDLIALYIHHIDADVVHYRDPVDRRTVLHFVAAYGEPADVRKCIVSGADLLAKDRFGETPLEIAHVSQRKDVFRALRAAGGADEVERAEQGPLVPAGRIVPAPAVEHVTDRNAPFRAVERQMFNTTSHQAYVESDDESDGEYQGFYSAPLSRASRASIETRSEQSSDDSQRPAYHDLPWQGPAGIIRRTKRIRATVQGHLHFREV